MKKKSPKRERKMIALPYRVWRVLNKVRAEMQAAADAECEKHDILCVNLSLADVVENLCERFAGQAAREPGKGGEDNHA